MGMLATVINALALQDALEQGGGDAGAERDHNAPGGRGVHPTAARLRHLEKGRVVIFGGGTGNPFFDGHGRCVARE